MFCGLQTEGLKASRQQLTASWVGGITSPSLPPACLPQIAVQILRTHP